MEARRPFTDPLSVSLAGLALAALAAGSFAVGVARKMSLPRPVDGATVVAMPPTDSPPPLPRLSSLDVAQADEAAAAAKAAALARLLAPVRVTPAREIGPEPLPPALAAAQVAEDAAATGATQAEPPPAPAPPVEQVPVY
jgi:hypothetical protein